MPTAQKELPVSGWRPRATFLDQHPELRSLLPNASSFDWALRVNRAQLEPYLRRRGRQVLIHDAAAGVLPDLLLKRLA
jgi:hypothetical protein